MLWGISNLLCVLCGACKVEIEWWTGDGSSPPYKVLQCYTA